MTGTPATAEMVLDEPRTRTPLITHDRVVDTAYDLVQVEGTEGLSMRKLASALHVSLPTIYSAIGSREELGQDLTDRIIAEAAERVDVARLEGVDAAQRLAAELTEWAATNRMLAGFLLDEDSTLVTRVEDAQMLGERAGRRLLVDVVQKLVDERYEGRIDLHVAITYYWSQIRTMLWLLRHQTWDPADVRRLSRLMIDNCNNGLARLAGE